MSKLIETAKKYGNDSFEYFKVACDIFNREELLERLFEAVKELNELNKRNEKAIEYMDKNPVGSYIELRNILTGGDEDE